jgi:hypothetical protein
MAQQPLMAFIFLDYAWIMLGTGAFAPDHAPLDRWLAALRQRPEVVLSIWELDAPVSPALRQRLLSNDLEALIAQLIQRKEPLGFDDILPSLPIPCVLMVGEADAAYARVQACSRMIRNSTFVSFPSLGHTGSFLNRAEVVCTCCSSCVAWREVGTKMLLGQVVLLGTPRPSLRYLRSFPISR